MAAKLLDRAGKTLDTVFVYIDGMDGWDIISVGLAPIVV